MHNIAVIGEHDSVMGFKVLGLDVFSVYDGRDVPQLIHKLARENYAVVFITETMAIDAAEAIGRYKTSSFPAIITIPNNQGSIGLGMSSIKSNVEKAIGSDIIFNEGR